MYFLTPITILFIGLIPLFVFKKRFNIENSIIVLGILSWIISISLKFFTVFMLNKPIYDLVMRIQPLFYYIYIGFLTGIFEVIIPLYIMEKRKKLFRGLWNQLGFGVSFGCFESIALGVLGILAFAIFISLQNILPFQYIANISLETERYIEIALYSSIERLSSIIIHMFSIMLLFIYIFRKRCIYLITAILYKTFIDSIIAFFVFSPLPFTFVHIELFYTIIAIITLFILLKIIRRW